MFKRLFIFFISIFFLLGFSGCKKEDSIVNEQDNSVVVKDDLESVQQTIREYYQSEKSKINNYGLSFCYIDLTNMTVVVGLMDNSKEQQEEFKKNVVNSEYITFVQGIELIDYIS